MDGAAMSALLWKPTLAATLPPDADLDALPYPLWASPKIDGFRCMGQRGTAVTRKGLRYRNTAVQALFEESDGEYEGLDGELCVGPPWAADVFNRTQNVVNDGSDTAAKEFFRHGFFHVFGLYGRLSSSPPEVMFAKLRLLKGLDKLRIVPQTVVTDKDRLLSFEARCLAKGYEGVMLRRCDGPGYPQKPGKENRSTLREFHLVKLKRFEYDEAVITGWRHLEHNLNEEKTVAGRRSSKKSGCVVDEARVGSVTLRDGAHEFSVNVQTDALRAKGPAWWSRQVGRQVRYTHQSVGRKELPRFPQCKFEELL